MTRNNLLCNINRVGDLLAAFVALGTVLMIANLGRMPGGLTPFLSMRVTMKNVFLLCVFLSLWTVVFDTLMVYDSRERLALRAELNRVLVAGTAAAPLALLFAATSVSGAFRVSYVFLFWLLVLSLLVSVRLIMYGLLRVRSLNNIPQRACLIIGTGAIAHRLYQTTQERQDVRYRVEGFVDNAGPHEIAPEVRSQIIGAISDLRTILKERIVDEVVVGLPVKSQYAVIQEVITICEEVGVPCKLPSNSFSYSIARPHVESDGAHSVITVRVKHDEVSQAVKRLVDIVGATAGLIILAPLMLGVAALIRSTSPGCVIFSQKRYGLNRRMFRMYKFRTMVADAEEMQAALECRNEASGPVFKIRHDPRVTKVGRFLRKTSLDELPQLWNVLLGSMSLVGPRPLPERDVSRFPEAWLMRRFSVKPGLTCLWQINGRSDTEFGRWIELDLQYIDRWSLGLDFSILARTVTAVWKGTGAA